MQRSYSPTLTGTQVFLGSVRSLEYRRTRSEMGNPIKKSRASTPFIFEAIVIALLGFGTPENDKTMKFGKPYHAAVN
jgi:hypothetical protein